MTQVLRILLFTVLCLLAEIAFARPKVNIKAFHTGVEEGHGLDVDLDIAAPHWSNLLRLLDRPHRK